MPAMQEQLQALRWHGRLQCRSQCRRGVGMVAFNIGAIAGVALPWWTATQEQLNALRFHGRLQ